MSNSEPSVIVRQCMPCMRGLYIDSNGRKRFAQGLAPFALSGSRMRSGSGEALEAVSRVAYRPVLHFPSFSILSRTRKAVILRISAKGNGFSSGNWIEPLAVANFERSFAKAFTADGVG